MDKNKLIRPRYECELEKNLDFDYLNRLESLNLTGYKHNLCCFLGIKI
jgi:hypothetical protein